MTKKHEINQLMRELNISWSLASGQKPSITIDWGKYEKLLGRDDIAPVQRMEMLKALWDIVVAFTDLDFGVHPLQKAQENNELNKESDGQNAQSAV